MRCRSIAHGLLCRVSTRRSYHVRKVTVLRRSLQLSTELTTDRVAIVFPRKDLMYHHNIMHMMLSKRHIHLELTVQCMFLICVSSFPIERWETDEKHSRTTRNHCVIDSAVTQVYSYHGAAFQTCWWWICDAFLGSLHRLARAKPLLSS